MDNQNKPTQFDQYIQYKALGFKFIGHTVPEHISEVGIEEAGEKAPIKNVCAKLHVELSNKLDDTVHILQMPKRKFIELALIDAIRRAELIMDEVDIMENLRDEGEQK